MENPITNAQWQAWQEWSRCAGSPPVKKRTRYCGISLRRKVQPNRTCKNSSGAGQRTGGRGESNKQTMPCTEDDIKKSQSSLGRTGFNRPNGGAPELSAPECYHPPGTKMVDDVFDDSQPLRIVGGKYIDFRSFVTYIFVVYMHDLAYITDEPNSNFYSVQYDDVSFKLLFLMLNK